ncbi:hypothetical protein KFK09_016476 [Dendrobium nobile]|uniref:Uncharacterized protein n=1 Tax=Dendrobium nobile TaxID=94219 RepID=A0A8T3AZL2_DENNO|nr:hypothetical protein KFK09_016476 [Dendrobium nobile]
MGDANLCPSSNRKRLNICLTQEKCMHGIAALGPLSTWMNSELSRLELDSVIRSQAEFIELQDRARLLN